MGFFSNLFGKQTCCLCGAECGAMSREKIKNKEYVCNECKKKCSSFVRISEMDKETVQEHIAFMEKREKIYQEILVNSKVQRFENKKKDKGFYFYDEHGFVVIENKKAGVTKLNHEVIRYDEIDSYELYTEMNEPTEAGKPKTFKEDGVLIRLVNTKPGVQLSTDTKNKGAHAYPYNTRDIKICMRTSEKDTQYADNVISHLNYVFGVYDNQTALFSFGMNKQQKRELQAQVDMAKLMGSAIKSAVSGEEDTEKLQEQMEQAQASTAAAETSGLSAYSAKADAAEAQVS